MDIKAKREEVREEIAFKLFEHYYLDVFQQVVSGFSWRNDYGWAKAKFYRRADEIISDLDSLGVMLVDKEAELPDNISKYFPKMGKRFQDEMQEAGYVKAIPLMKVKE